jgi:predicted ATP-dependent endonuclease of OLD family
MIESIRLQNFMCHVDASLRLAPFTVLVGPNGTGKSAILHALRLLADVRLASRHLSSSPPSLVETNAQNRKLFTRRAVHPVGLAVATR